MNIWVKLGVEWNEQVVEAITDDNELRMAGCLVAGGGVRVVAAKKDDFIIGVSLGVVVPEWCLSIWEEVEL